LLRVPEGREAARSKVSHLVRSRSQRGKGEIDSLGLEGARSTWSAASSPKEKKQRTGLFFPYPFSTCHPKGAGGGRGERRGVCVLRTAVAKQSLF